MSMSKWWAWLAAAVSLVGPLPAAAQQAPDYGRPGFFGGMHFVYGYEDFDRPGGVDVDDSQGPFEPVDMFPAADLEQSASQKYGSDAFA